MKIDEVLRTAQDAVTVRRVYAEPYEKDGVTIVPAAVIAGGGGGGAGHDPKGQEGEGGGFGLGARPAGAFVIENGKARWHPAVDPNRIVVMVGLTAIAYLLTRPRLARARALAAG